MPSAISSRKGPSEAERPFARCLSMPSQATQWSASSRKSSGMASGSSWNGETPRAFGGAASFTSERRTSSLRDKFSFLRRHRLSRKECRYRVTSRRPIHGLGPRRETHENSAKLPDHKPNVLPQRGVHGHSTLRADLVRQTPGTSVCHRADRFLELFLV